MRRTWSMDERRGLANRPRQRKVTLGAGLVLLAATLFLLSPLPASACVSKTLTIGVLNSPPEILYAELIAQMTTERTGTTVKVVPFNDAGGLYDAVKKGDVGVIIENTVQGLKELGLPQGEHGQGAYETVKLAYREKLNLIWLKPVPADGGDLYYAPVILAETMENLPALPKLINRLTGALTEQSFARLTQEAKGKEKPREVARDFLKTKRLI